MVEQQITQVEDAILGLVREEREKALSPREWKFRLRGYGYDVKDEDGAQVLTRLHNGEKIGILPPDFVYSQRSVVTPRKGLPHRLRRPIVDGRKRFVGGFDKLEKIEIFG